VEKEGLAVWYNAGVVCFHKELAGHLLQSRNGRWHRDGRAIDEGTEYVVLKVAPHAREVHFGANA